MSKTNEGMTSKKNISFIDKKINNKNLYFLLDLDSSSIFIKYYKEILNFFNKKKYKLHLLDIEFNRKIKIRQKNNLKFLNIYHPRNLEDLKNYLKKNNGIIVKNYTDLFKFYKINFLLRTLNYKIIELANLGNIQQSEYYHIKKNLLFLKKLLFYYFPIKFSVILSSIGIFCKIYLRFESNAKVFNGFQKNKKKFFLLRKPSKYLDMINVRSVIFDKKKKKLSNKYITLLEFDPNYIEERRSNKILKKDLDNYYLKMNILLKKIEQIFKKKVIICIHPLYDLKAIKNRYKDFRVFINRTSDFIAKSQIIMFFDSSAIMEAIYQKKKIISIEASIYGKKKNRSNIYSDALNTHVINIEKPIFYKRKKFLKLLDNKVKNYDSFLKIYGSSNSKNGRYQILKSIENL